MTKIKEGIEELLANIAYAEGGEYQPDHMRSEKADSLEDVFTAIGMAEGGDDDYARRLHPLFCARRCNN